MPGRERLSDNNNDIPNTLQPVKVGAVVNWKTTAIAEHTAHVAYREESRYLKSVMCDQAKEIADLTNTLRDTRDYRENLDTLRLSIGAHWSSFLLPRAIRQRLRAL